MCNSKNIWENKIDWGLMAFSTMFQSYGGQFTYSCVSWVSNNSTLNNNPSKQLAAFPHNNLSPLVEQA